MKAIALVLAALSLSAGATAVAEPVESLESVETYDVGCSGFKPYTPRGCTAVCICSPQSYGTIRECSWSVVC